MRRACSPRRYSATCKRSAHLALCSIPETGSVAATTRISCAQDESRKRCAGSRCPPHAQARRRGGAHHVGERALGTGPQHKLVHSGNADPARGFPFHDNSAFSPRFWRAREASAARTSGACRLGWALTTASISAWSRSEDLNGRAVSVAGPARTARHLSPRIQRRARPSSAPSRCAETRSRGARAEAPVLPRQCAGRRSPDPCCCSSPPLRPTLRTGMRRIARADQTAIVKPSRLGLDHVADAAPRLHEMVDLAPPGHQPPSERSALAGQFAQYAAGQRSRSPRPPDCGANQGALFRHRQPPVAPLWPHETPDRADPPAARS